MTFISLKTVKIVVLVKIVVILSVAQLLKTVIFFSASHKINPSADINTNYTCTCIWVGVDPVIVIGFTE